MKIIVLFIFTILLKTIIVSSLNKCKNPNVTCYELCCKIDQTYVEEFRWCKDLPQYGKPAWSATIGNLTKLGYASIVEYGECSLISEQSVIGQCYSPYYENKRNDNAMFLYSNVPCDRLKPYPDYHIILGLAIMALAPLCLPILLSFTCTKKDKKNQLGYKLIAWYLTSVIANLLSGALWLYVEDTIKAKDSPLLYFRILAEFFGISTYYWLSCIGYNVYVQFKEANIQNTERMRKDRMRFICFSIFVWVGTLTNCIVYRMVENEKIISGLGPMYAIALFNCIVFLVLAVKICLIRCGVIGISTEKHIKCKLALVICRLALLMGIPRILFLTLGLFIEYNPLYLIYIIVEPYIVYVTFILENENCCTLLRSKCCCSASRNDDDNKAMEDITTKRTTTA